MFLTPAGKSTLICMLLLYELSMCIYAETSLQKSILNKNYSYLCLIITITLLTILSLFSIIKNPSKVQENTKSDINNFYCKTCQRYIPLRSSHCDNCGYCIRRRDHHCTYLGICIGQDNNFSFLCFNVFMLICQCVFAKNTFFVAVKDVDFYDFLRFNFQCGLICCISVYICFISFDQIIKLFMNVFLNQTYWETRRKDKISYLKTWPYPISPFSRGLCNNIQEFATMKGKDLNYEIPHNIEEYEHSNSRILNMITKFQ